MNRKGHVLTCDELSGAAGETRERQWVPTRASVFFIVVFAAVTSLRLQAKGLDWPVTELRAAAAVGKDAVAVLFPFRNGGNKPVRLVSIRPSCDCVTATVAKEVWAPGESGELTAVFTVDGRTGLQNRNLVVTTDDEPGNPVVLKLVIEIPEEVSIRPELVSWTLGDEPLAKTVEVLVRDAAPTAKAEVQCTDGRFLASIELGPKPGMWLVRVQPRDTDKPAQAAVRVAVTVGGKPRVQLLYAVVK
jgi:hypothetical protein